MRGKMKRIISLLLALSLMCVAAPVSEKKADAATIVNPIDYNLGDKITGNLSKDNKVFFYKVVLPESGQVSIKGTAKMPWIQLYWYDEDGNEMRKWSMSKDSATDQIGCNESFFVTSGTYYFTVEQYNADSVGNFEFTLNLTSSNETFKEVNGGSNNSFAAATAITPDSTTYKAQIALNDMIDYWKFELPSSGKIDLKAIFYNMSFVSWALYDENEKKLISHDESCDSATKQISMKKEWYLTKGTYYLEIRNYNDNETSFGRYEFSMPFTSSNESFEETNGGTNNSMDTASPGVLGRQYKGHLGYNDAVDYYKYTVSSASPVIVKLTTPLNWIEVSLCDVNGNKVWSNSPSKGSSASQINFEKVEQVQPGVYYVRVERYNDDYQGDYNLTVSILSQSNCPHQKYDSTSHDATYFARGYTTYKCRMCGHTYNADYKAVKKLSKAYWGYSCFGGKKFLSLSWGSVWDATGYQIRYSKKKNMKKAKIKTIKGKTSKKLKKMGRKKKYYVQVRAYKKSGSKTVYGTWSAKKKLKTK